MLRVLIILVALYCYPQSHVGVASERYSGFNGTAINPTSFINSPIDQEINVFGIDFQFDSDYGFIKNSSYLEFPDNQLDTVPFLEIVKKIENKIFEIKPERILTHSNLDLNIDHRIVSQAVITATRPIKKNPVREILFYEVLSSSEWNFGNKRFIPNYYIDVSKQVKKKFRAFKCYRQEIEAFPHPRSIAGIETLMKYRGMESGLKFAEAFYLVRLIIK